MECLCSRDWPSFPKFFLKRIIISLARELPRSCTRLTRWFPAIRLPPLPNNPPGCTSRATCPVWATFHRSTLTWFRSPYLSILNICTQLLAQTFNHVVVMVLPPVACVSPPLSRSFGGGFVLFLRWIGNCWRWSSPFYQRSGQQQWYGSFRWYRRFFLSGRSVGYPCQ